MVRMSIDLLPGREASIGALNVRRTLPTRGRRTVGAWCFVDHMGPLSLSPEINADVAPHPHTGLQTVTWLFSGEILHRDSLGSEQLIVPGQLNLMSAGRGVVHAEENPGLTSGTLHGMQLWIAQPEATRHDVPAFEHHSELSRVELPRAVATVLVGSFADVESRARRDSELVGVELVLSGGEVAFEVRPDFEYALIVASGALQVEGLRIEPGSLGYLGAGRSELRLTSDEGARALLIGGVPCEESLFMWWNFVLRTKDEVTEAWRAWATGDERFGAVNSRLDRIPVGPPIWLNPSL